MTRLASRFFIATIVLAAGSQASAQAEPSRGPAPASAVAVYPDMVFQPIAPCRVFNTSLFAKIPARGSSSFQIAGAEGFAEQGGKTGGCGVPPYAVMVSFTLTALQPETRGFASASRTAEDPKLRLVSFQSGAAATGGGNLWLSDGRLVIHSSAAANVMGEVTGFFAPEMWATVRGDGQLYASSGRFVSGRRKAVGVYEVVADRQVHICGATATVAVQNYHATAVTDLPVKDFVTVKVFDAAGQPVDAPFTVRVDC